MPPKIELTPVQRDCLEAKGDCTLCPNNILESGPCKVKYSKGVARKLGLKEIVPTNPCNATKAAEKVCKFCGTEFVTWLHSAKFCNPCAAKRLKVSDGASLRVCACGSKFFGFSGTKRCDDCRGRKVSA